MGTNITALIRDLLIEYGIPSDEAQRRADEIEDSQLAISDWLVTSRGITFDKSWPKTE